MSHDHDHPHEHKAGERPPWKTNPLGLIGRVPSLAGVALIKAYRVLLSPLIGNTCRYLPSCSNYTEDAIRRYGLWPGFWIGMARFQRCGPNGASGYDPIPEALAANARWYLPWRYGRWNGAHIDPATRLDLRD